MKRNRLLCVVHSSICIVPPFLLTLSLSFFFVLFIVKMLGNKSFAHELDDVPTFQSRFSSSSLLCGMCVCVCGGISLFVAEKWE